jgi:hypothetical protein
VVDKGWSVKKKKKLAGDGRSRKKGRGCNSLGEWVGQLVRCEIKVNGEGAYALVLSSLLSLLLLLLLALLSSQLE